MADTSMKVVLRMFFLTFSNTNIVFKKYKLTWRIYILAKALPTTKQV